jgi:hypothetical protein
MAKFISTDEGWVNLSHVAVVRQRHYVGQKPFLIFEAPDGRSLGRATNPDQDVGTLLAEIWPAASRAVALVVWTYCDANHDGRPDSVRSQLVPITGWRLTYGTPEPVLPEEADGNTRALIELPDGRYLEQEGATYADVADAEAHILADDQSFWDATQRARAVRAKSAQP